ncbi:hypothetical protein [Mangrovivirga cuniculi]|uniref:Uncharacterized protein n=1 Tax=Mangrovivirga cuniculi TaxID=2715131 RepID=A0A4D7JCM1_9BACT|nr:hypothetical protein [Mangrovivirga cuniculi]QCK14099.1 hypothetical protein DCC35_04705 [Mangrovivirga cuniculi]
MLYAINHDSWENTKYVSWNFSDRHSFIWDKKSHLACVKWDDYKALIDLKKSQGIVYDDGKLIEDPSDNAKLVKKAIDHFNNDSFWLNAPAKAFDPGTERRIVDYEGRKTLLITYTSGGTTPGDSYLWFLDENGLPEYYKMWASILPVKGLKATWEDWTEINSGALLSTSHEILFIDVEIKDLKSAETLNEISPDDPELFSPLKN